MSQPVSPLSQSLTLPNGQVLKNRIAKASMEESLADDDFLPGKGMIRLYERWGKGGAGLLLTGNAMVDPTALTGPGNVIIRDQGKLDHFKRWAEAGKSGGSKIWMQINHPGRQVFSFISETPVAPSAVKVHIPGRMFAKVFGTPRALTEDEIKKIIDRFIQAAVIAEKAGFDGIEVHGAHGYLINQFLSPLTNLRKDQWGGSLENRARILLEIVNGIRASTQKEFGVGVKLNSADFQGGGFAEEDAIQVIQMLNQSKLDLLEISGGNYESPAMQGGESNGTRKREAYFLDFAKKARSIAKMPLMSTGGFRSKNIMENAITSGAIDLIGIAAPFAFDPDCASRILSGNAETIEFNLPNLSNPVFSSLSKMSAIKFQFRRMGQGKEPRIPRSMIGNLLWEQIRARRNAKKYKALFQN
ncbi:NADH:flavin oxidoreductase/NADH oxidase family protein [Leptospira yasudae]|uniref:NADH:flavin oxidoreductase/NADH oxidase family protein n=1 Tax=Leptospira yasudae TaxID=2202201 RepID=UPI001082B77D|nr:NADH:flavin oxidoreductase/NADH oxidase family protein [Leptospira yasudae]TGK30531.1 NADH:flavin oxidoreductase/NADH oxidase family protein [Leptospira yasudae]TGM04089.1 NADH:flavin oxidoreductase/NADH oxidase family protein [Leptospira yasudae]